MPSSQKETPYSHSSKRIISAACLAAILWGGSATASLLAAEAPSADLLQLIADLVSDPDKEMRAIGLQQVRSEAPGEAATKEFVQLLPKLRPEACAELVEALGERGDPAAGPAILEVLQSPDEATRAAALRALAKLGSEADVPLLVQRTAAGSAAEQLAASQSLTRLKGEGVNRAIVAQLGPAPSGLRVRLLEILAARNAVEALPAVVASASHPDAMVRLAALDALRVLADEGQAGDLVKLLQTAESDAHRTKAEAALLALCSRARDKCVPALASGLTGADARTRATLLQALARAGGSAALEAVASCLEDSEQTVRDEAVRMLSLWPDRAVVPRLEKIAAAESLRHHVLAIRGLVRLASPEGDQPADMKLLGGAIRLAKRRDEKQLALGVLSRAATAESLTLAVSLLADPTIAEEAGWTAGVIAESLPAEHQEAVRAAMRQVLERTQSQKAREQAQKVQC
ncbi:MAG: HEAT repeat domain-containing protein [Pirellulaceae bacterium]|nr:HEAT repeat domain-containing protein [Pirellulaceae bacterium]